MLASRGKEAEKMERWPLVDGHVDRQTFFHKLSCEASELSSVEVQAAERRATPSSLVRMCVRRMFKWGFDREMLISVD
ncbi:unnamed protein product [Linum trigynum]|uniref:Uncharacterized protein n=1 Tax=Linum trigynum TaxID=586398 RepID=A0AAV2FBX4_9ROSI